MRHAVLMSADPAGARIAAGYDFAENGEIRIDAVITLGSSESDPEACDDLITYKKRSVFAG